MNSKRYVLFADEMGTPGLAYGTSNTFVFGGYLCADSELSKVTSLWRSIKSELCGDPDVELKWKHFFVDENNSKIKTPILIKSRSVRNTLAYEVLDRLFSNAPIKPLVTIVRKNRVSSDALIVKSHKGKDKLDDSMLWLPTIGQFALFLNLHHAKGRISFDHLGSAKQEQKLQDDLSTLCRTVRDEQLPPSVLKNMRKVLAIDETISFLDSAQNESIQIADFVIGVIWNAGQEDERYLTRFIKHYGRNASSQGLGIVQIK